jgi:hypothetical protein
MHADSLDLHSDGLFARSDFVVACLLHKESITWLHPQAPAVVGANPVIVTVTLLDMSELRKEPPQTLGDLREILLQQLSYYRASLLTKLDGLSDDQLSTSVLPSAWSPLGLLKHLVFVERRWMQWGFESEQVPDPWGDHDRDSDGWLLEPDETLYVLTERLRAIAARTDAIAREAELTDRAGLGGRFTAIRPHLAGS